MVLLYLRRDIAVDFCSAILLDSLAEIHPSRHLVHMLTAYIFKELEIRSEVVKFFKPPTHTPIPLSSPHAIVAQNP
jgi:hypothetical protein